LGKGGKNADIADNAVIAGKGRMGGDTKKANRRPQRGKAATINRRTRANHTVSVARRGR
jgi:hypothetical protein